MNFPWDKRFERVRSMQESDLEELATWKYPDPYAIYSPSLEGPSGQAARAEFLSDAYYAVVDVDDRLVGYFCYGNPAQVPAGFEAGAYGEADFLDIGLGLRPELTGAGLGAGFVLRGMRLARQYYDPSGLRLTVATFNQRAIKVYETLGFVASMRFSASTPQWTLDFQVMKAREWSLEPIERAMR